MNTPSGRHSYKVQDNMATHPSLALGTTAGSLALLDSQPPRKAVIVDMVC